MPGTDPLSRVWYSKVGSKLELVVRGSKLEGYFHSTEGPAGKFEVFGSVDPDASLPDRALSFSVCWIRSDSSNKYRSVSSYTGQYHRFDDGEEVINTVFLLVDETGKQFASTFVGYDNFDTTEPSPEQIKKARRGKF